MNSSNFQFLLCPKTFFTWGVANFIMNPTIHLHLQRWCKSNFKIRNYNGDVKQTLGLNIVVFHTFCWLQIATCFNSLYIIAKCDITNMWFISKINKIAFYFIFGICGHIMCWIKKIRYIKKLNSINTLKLQP